MRPIHRQEFWAARAMPTWLLLIHLLLAAAASRTAHATRGPVLAQSTVEDSLPLSICSAPMTWFGPDGTVMRRVSASGTECQLLYEVAAPLGLVDIALDFAGSNGAAWSVEVLAGPSPAQLASLQKGTSNTTGAGTTAGLLSLASLAWKEQTLQGSPDGLRMGCSRSALILLRSPIPPTSLGSWPLRPRAVRLRIGCTPECSQGGAVCQPAEGDPPAAVAASGAAGSSVNNAAPRVRAVAMTCTLTRWVPMQLRSL